MDQLGRCVISPHQNKQLRLPLPASYPTSHLTSLPRPTIRSPHLRYIVSWADVSAVPHSLGERPPILSLPPRSIIRASPNSISSGSHLTDALQTV